MATRFHRYAVFHSLLAVIVAVLIYGIAADSENAAFFLNGVMANVFDPLIWLIALPFALKIRRNAILFPILFIVAALVAIFKLYMLWKHGTGWIVGSVAGNVVGLMTVGYIINTIAVFRRGRRELRDDHGV